MAQTVPLKFDSPFFPIALGEQRGLGDIHLIDKAVLQISGNLLLAGYPCLPLPCGQFAVANGLQRNVALTLPGFHSAMMLTMKSDFILPLPRHVLQGVSGIGLPLEEIELPLVLESVFIVQAWHPRLDRDPAHQWLRQTIKQFFLQREE